MFWVKENPPASNSLGDEAPKVAFTVFLIVKSKLLVPYVLEKSISQSPILPFIPAAIDLSNTRDAIWGKKPLANAAVLPLPSE